MMYGNNYPPPQMPQHGFYQSPSDYMMQKHQAMEAEKHSMRKNVTKAALLLILYNALNYAGIRMYYVIFYCVVSKTFTVDLDHAVNGLRENYAEQIKGTAFSMGGMLFTVILSGLIVFLAAQFVLKTDLASWFKPSKEKLKTGMFWGPAFITVNLMMSVFVSEIVDLLSSEGVNVPTADFSIKTSSPSSLKAALILQFLYVCIFGPVVEELIYRGVVLKLIAPYGKGLAVFVSALFFGLMHGNIEQTVTTMVGGLLFALVAVYSDSLVPTIVIHILNNSVASMNEFGRALGKDFSKAYLTVSIIFMVLGFYILIVFLIGLVKKTIENNSYALSVKKRTQEVFLNLLMLGYMIVFLIYPYIMSFVNAN